MSLKVEGVGITPTDYGKHLEGKPIQTMVNIEKKVSGKGDGPLGESKEQYPGFFCKKNSGFSISVSGGRTLNLGNYESARIDVSITVPSDPELLNQAYDWGADWVSKKIEEAVAQVK